MRLYDDFNEESDIDILIEYDNPMGIEFIDLALELEKLLNQIGSIQY